MTESKLWWKKYEPETIKDLVIPDDLRIYLEEMIQQDESNNILFYGPAGCGKTSSANVIIKELNCNHLYINGSSQTSIDNIRNEVESFAGNFGIFDEKKKIVLIDECDRVSSAGQDALKSIIEQVERFSRFIFTTNNVHKIIPELRSRMQKEFDFGSNNSTKKQLITSFFNRVKYILKSEGIDEFNEKAILELIVNKFPDFRKAINELQSYYIIHKKIDENLSLFSGSIDKFNELIEAMKKREYKKIRALVSEIDPNTFYSMFYKNIDKMISDESKVAVILLLSHYGFQNNNCIDKEINLAAIVFEISQKVKWK